MSQLSLLLQEYLEMRLSCGFKVLSTRKVLINFVRFAESIGADFITPEVFFRWKAEFGSASSKTWSMRLGQLVLFSGWLNAVDKRHKLLPRNLVSSRYYRKRPYIYKEDEVTAIIQAAEKLPSQNGIRSITYVALFGLLASTGLRVGEAISLQVGDVDLDCGVITVHRAKYGRERLVPMSPSVVQHMGEYARRRDRILGEQRASFFVSDSGAQLSYTAVHATFARASINAGVREEPRNSRQSGSGPRIHDLRHTFAVNVLKESYRKFKDPSPVMLILSTYLGHARPGHTYWYIEAVPELMALAGERFENRLEGGEQ
jgi:integrase